MIKGIYKDVLNILRKNPDTRNSDKELYIAWLAEHKPDAISAPFITTLYNSTLPTFESVGRARRKAQENFPELKGVDNIQAARELLEDEYREFARAN